MDARDNGGSADDRDAADSGRSLERRREKTSNRRINEDQSAVCVVQAGIDKVESIKFN